MTQLPTIHLIHASDAPQHLGKLKEILQKLKAENRIADFTTWDIHADPVSLADQAGDDDLVLTLLTYDLEPRKEEIESMLREVKTQTPGLKIAEIIIDHVPYENEFITFPADLKPIRSREDMDAVWNDIEQNLKQMFPVQEAEPVTKPVNWSKYLKIAGIVILLIGFAFVLYKLFDDGPSRDRVIIDPIDPPIEDTDTPIAVLDCYVETSLLTKAHLEPNLFSTTQGTFPRNKKYNVIDTEVYHHGDLDEIYFFLIEDQERGLKGWVNSESLKYFSTDCMNE